MSAPEECAVVAVANRRGEAAMWDTIWALHGRLEVDAINSFTEVTKNGRVAAVFQRRHLAGRSANAHRGVNRV
jgi:hypothetical protein